MDPSDYALRDALEDWREATTQTVYGWALYHDLGPCLIMPNGVLDHIVICAHDHRIDSTSTLVKETRWDLASTYANDILALINKHHPKPLPPAGAIINPPSTPPQHTTQFNVALSPSCSTNSATFAASDAVSANSTTADTGEGESLEEDEIEANL
jgi:hypothetical protein